MKFIQATILLSMLTACSQTENNEQKPIRLVTLDPGHFHAALVQKKMYEDIDSVVAVYATESSDLQMHLDRINAYNTRTESPTLWKENVYTGADFFERMITEKKGNVVVLSGNNQKKTDYILRSLQNGFHVFADKPMVIDSKGFDQLKKAFTIAAKNKFLLYDIMTERYEITTMLQKACSMIPTLFGKLEKGSPENPAITKESVHHFYKYVSGNVLTRPTWFMDVSQQGEGIVDVMTHLVDLVQWECFPEQIIDYTKDIDIIDAKRWATSMSLTQFSAITKQADFPTNLSNQIKNDSLLQIYCNGEINYTIKGVHAKTAVIWNYKAPEGTGDTHYSIMRGTKADLVIQQGKEENYKPTLYINQKKNSNTNELKKAFIKLQEQFPGLTFEELNGKWKAIIPNSLKEGHEAHFASVTEKFLSYLKNNSMPAWEVPNMLAKYYTTTKALEISLNKK